MVCYIIGVLVAKLTTAVVMVRPGSLDLRVGMDVRKTTININII